ncbi:MAG: UDP-N-acetylmuramate dehydrogenase [Deltaproteobacteria bacterium]|nr:UDP-N-acetylmuramate dehydrogenase [Deltaproteobacteria bacterium]
MAWHTTWRIGGPADRFHRPAAISDLAELLRGLPPGEEIVVVGGGSNLLVADAGIRGRVIMMRALKAMDREGENLRVGAGMLLPELLQSLAREGWGGLEFLAGIPGTVGGAVRMNAGTGDGSISDRLTAVTMMDRNGRLERWEADRIDFGYRKSGLPDDRLIVEAELILEQGDPGVILRTIRKLWAERKKKQPLSLPSAGCVFKNPPGKTAGRLIDLCGMKGVRVGDAEVSEVHANFIVNRGHARAVDVLELIGKVREKVKGRFGIVLKPEIRLVGDFPPGGCCQE